MEESAPTVFWVVIVTGAVSGLVVAVLGHALLTVPLIRVKVRHSLTVKFDPNVQDEPEAVVESVVYVTNLRGRPVTIKDVWILKKRVPRGQPKMGRPRGWTFQEAHLVEGKTLAWSFDRADFPNAVAVAIDTADRIWPRRRWFSVKRRALGASRYIGWPWQRNGPTDHQIERARESARKRAASMSGH